jgi:hypothetical protein
MSAEPSAAADVVHPASVRRLTRASLWPLLVLAIGNGLFLYLLPGMAATRYAWSITPPINAAFMGAGYLAGIVAGGVAIFGARRWRSFRALALPFAVLGAVMELATLVHADRFLWAYPPTWAWAFVYALLPPAAVWLWFQQERAAGAAPAHDRRTRSARWLAWPLGLVLLVVGVLLFVTPDTALAAWPWPITTLLARTFAAWYLLMGGILVFGATTFRQPNELPIPFLTVAAWSVLVLLLPLVYQDSLRTGSAAFWPWLALHAALLVACAWVAIQSLARLRATGQRL